MTVSSDFLTHLNSVAAITDMVGSRICQAPIHAKESLPYVVFMRNGRQGEVTLDSSEGPQQTFIDMECRGRDQAEAEQLADLIRTTLHGYRGTWGTRRIQGVFVNDQDDDYVQIPAGRNQAEVSIATRIEIWS